MTKPAKPILRPQPAFESARLRAAAFAIAFGAAAGLAAPDDAAAEPAIWRMADADSVVWLFGSVHTLPPELDWRSDALDAALDAAEVVYFEAPTDVFAQMRLQSLVVEIGFNPPGAPLSSQLPPETAARLGEVADALGIRRAEVELMRPWLAFMLIAARIAQNGGSDADHGVDAVLELAARRAAKEIRTFETLEQQTRFFADLAVADQIAILEQTLRDFDLADEMLNDLFDAWATADLARLETVIFASFGDLPPTFLDVVFRRRNADWADQIEDLMGGAGEALVVVGAGHLVGPDSLIQMLRDRGFDVQRE